MALSIQPYKGARDFYPDDKRLQKYIFGVMRNVVEKYGYQEYDAPILEPFELYKAKTGEEIVNEQTYIFEDRGGRKVAIRPEMTPSVSRMVAGKRQELIYPLRWFSIPNLWRYERPQRGRLREHWQLNVDIFGVNGNEAELELLTITDNIMQEFGAKRSMYTIRINSRKLVNYLLHDFLGLNEGQAHILSKLIDRMHKIEKSKFISECEIVFSAQQRKENKLETFLKILEVKTIDDLPKELLSHHSTKELSGLLIGLNNQGITNAQFDITLMRGFDYYTDIVFEVFDNHPDNNRSMFGGGRYDGLVGLFGVEPLPTVGFGMGDVTLANFLEIHSLLPDFDPEFDLYIVLIGQIYAECQPIFNKLREAGLKVVVDPTGKKADKAIKSAIKSNVNYLLFIGPDELKSKKYMLKNLNKSVEHQLDLKGIINSVKNKI